MRLWTSTARARAVRLQDIDSDGHVAGALLLRKTDRSLGLFDRVAARFADHRDPRLTEHSVRTLVAQRITGIALGYEDLKDYDELRRDPVLTLLSGKDENAGRAARRWRAGAR